MLGSNGQIKDREKALPRNCDHYYIHRAEAHLVRLRRGAACMGLDISWSVDEMLKGIEDLLELEPKGTQYIRPIAFRGGPELWATGSQWRPVDVCLHRNS